MGLAPDLGAVTPGTAIRDIETETLERWLRNNALIIDQYDSVNEAAQAAQCMWRLREIAAELIRRKGP